MILLISEETIKAETIVSNNLEGAYLRAAIEKAQDIELYEVLGSQLYNKIINLVNNDEINEDKNEAYKFLLDEYISKYLKWAVLADIITPLNFKFRNAGLVTNNDNQHYKTNSLSDSEMISDIYQKNAADYSLRMTKYIWANRSKYPEYCKCKDCSDTLPNRFAGYKTHINI